MSKEIVQSLLPNHLYDFHTAGGLVTKSVLPYVYSEIFNSADPLEKITDDTGVTLWESNNGMGDWDVDHYSSIVFSIIDLIDKKFDAENKTNEQFIPQAIDDCLTPLEAVNSWLLDALPNTKIIVSRHIKDMLDIELTAVAGGLSEMRRVVIDQSPKKGDVFNVYYANSSKGGAVFDLDVLGSVADYLRNIELERTEKPSDTYLTIYKQAQEVGLLILVNQGYSGSPEMIHSEHENVRVRNAFKAACDILEKLQNHEMSDIVTEVEEYKQSA